METLHSIFNEGAHKTETKIENGDTIKFYAFNGYNPIIRRLIKEEVHLPGTSGCFSQMFIEKGKAKALSIYENKNKEIESVCFVIQDSWIIGNGIPQGPKFLGNIGYYTHDRFRGKGLSKILSQDLENNLNTIVPDLKNRVGHIQYHVFPKFRNYFNIIKINEMRYGENFVDFFDPRDLKNPYSVDLQKEQNRITKHMFW